MLNKHQSISHFDLTVDFFVVWHLLQRFSGNLKKYITYFLVKNNFQLFICNRSGLKSIYCLTLLSFSQTFIDFLISAAFLRFLELLT